jgi:hypothetical protein
MKIIIEEDIKDGWVYIDWSVTGKHTGKEVALLVFRFIKDHEPGWSDTTTSGNTKIIIEGDVDHKTKILVENEKSQKELSWLIANFYQDYLNAIDKNDKERSQRAKKAWKTRRYNNWMNSYLDG